MTWQICLHFFSVYRFFSSPLSLSLSSRSNVLVDRHQTECTESQLIYQYLELQINCHIVMNCWLVCLHNNCHYGKWETEREGEAATESKERERKDWIQWEKRIRWMSISNSRRIFWFQMFDYRHKIYLFKVVRQQQHMPTKRTMDNNRSLRMAALLLLSAVLCKFFGKNRWIPCMLPIFCCVFFLCVLGGFGGGGAWGAGGFFLTGARSCSIACFTEIKKQNKFSVATNYKRQIFIVNFFFSPIFVSVCCSFGCFCFA